MPSVSVIVPNYNHARFLRRRIDTILAQTFGDFELILLDDCSTDGSRSILSEYASDTRVRIEFNEANSGNTFKQWNKGFGLARGKYVWIAESDDYAEKHLLERLMEVLELDPQIVLAYCRSWRVDDDDRILGFGDFYLGPYNARQWSEDFLMDGRKMCQTYFCRINPIPNASSVVFRSEIYERAGGADEALQLCGDWKLWAAMALMGKVAYLCEPLNYFRFHALSVRTRKQAERVDVPERLHICQWVLEHGGVSKELREVICKEKAALWVPELLRFRNPRALKRLIWQRVRALDPHPFRRWMGPALTTARLKIMRHWHQLCSRLGQNTNCS